MIRYVSLKRGNDSNKGTLTKPLKTISKAISNSIEDDIIFVIADITHEQIINKLSK